MAATGTSAAFLDIPSNVTGTALVLAINDRLRRITQALNADDPSVVSADLVMNGYRVTVLGNAVNPQDALNMRTADGRYATAAQLKAAAAMTTVVTQAASATAGTLLLTVPGVLAVQSQAAALVSFPTAQSWTSVTLLVKMAPVGAAITVSFNAGSAVLGTATIANGATSSTTAVSWTLPANTVLSVDVTGVGIPTFPGADLTIELS